MGKKDLPQQKASLLVNTQVEEAPVSTDPKTQFPDTPGTEEFTHSSRLLTILTQIRENPDEVQTKFPGAKFVIIDSVEGEIVHGGKDRTEVHAHLTKIQEDDRGLLRYSMCKVA